MNLRDDEIAFLGTERCYCGHLESLHIVNEWDERYCLIEPSARHHFCSERERDDHFVEQERIRGNPAVGRPWPCRECQEESKISIAGA